MRIIVKEEDVSWRDGQNEHFEEMSIEEVLSVLYPEHEGRYFCCSHAIYTKSGDWHRNLDTIVDMLDGKPMMAFKENIVIGCSFLDESNAIMYTSACNNIKNDVNLLKDFIYDMGERIPEAKPGYNGLVSNLGYQKHSVIKDDFNRMIEDRIISWWKMEAVELESNKTPKTYRVFLNIGDIYGKPIDHTFMFLNL